MELLHNRPRIYLLSCTVRKIMRLFFPGFAATPAANHPRALFFHARCPSGKTSCYLRIVAVKRECYDRQHCAPFCGFPRKGNGAREDSLSFPSLPSRCHRIPLTLILLSMDGENSAALLFSGRTDTTVTGKRDGNWNNKRTLRRKLGMRMADVEGGWRGGRPPPATDPTALKFFFEKNPRRTRSSIPRYVGRLRGGGVSSKILSLFSNRSRTIRSLGHDTFASFRTKTALFVTLEQSDLVRPIVRQWSNDRAPGSK